MRQLDLSALRTCVTRLNEGIARLAQAPQDEVFQESLIQRFEYSYEVSLKVLQRALHVKIGLADDPIARMSLPVTVRTAYEYGLLRSSWDVWDTFRDARNRTSHTYSQEAANAVLAVIPAFAKEVESLLERLHALE
jgi:nucleotidyltransferase substrate binding protein (TIGR01987 family)